MPDLYGGGIFVSVELIHGVPGVPDYSKQEFAEKQAEYCLLIPIIN